MSVRMKRLLVASALVAALVAIPPSVESLRDYGQLSLAQDVPLLIMHENWGGASVERALQARLSDSGTPKGFSEELFDLGDKQALLMAEEAGVVSFQMSEAPAEALSMLSLMLEQKGWSGACAADESVGTFVKDRGAYRWAYLSCSEVSGSTVVVVQVERAI